MRAGEEFRQTLPPRHSSPALVAMTARSRSPPESARPTISSERPDPYTGAVSISVIPRSIAERMVRIDSSRSEFPPHIQPPIAHVPSAMREAQSPDVPISIVSMVLILPLIVDGQSSRHAVALHLLLDKPGLL